MPYFKTPNIKQEIGEIERTATETFAKDFKESFVDEFIKRATKSRLVKLEESIWRKLENTDSFDIKKDDWKAVEYHAAQEGRNWEDLKDKLEKKTSIDAPMILKKDQMFHLVSGNTRLMVASALDIDPEVLIVDMTDFENPRIKELEEKIQEFQKNIKELEKELADLKK